MWRKILFNYFYLFPMLNHLDQSSNRDSECRLFEWKYNSKDVFEDYLDWCDKRRAFQLQVIIIFIVIIIIIIVVIIIISLISYIICSNVLRA